MGQPNAYPTGTVTFLFTDVEGSTRRWERDRPAMAAALARHDALLRQAIGANGGHVFKTVGDAFCAAFPTAPAALRAALAAQRALAAEPWNGAGPLRVRAALHAGEAEERDADYFGPAVNRVARLLAAGHGGQVLLSLPAGELVRDALPEGAALRDLGEHRLKDLARPERVFQLLAPDLPSDFPPLTSLDAHPNNLPVQLTPFVGRAREVATLAELLRRHEARLVTLTGPGGVGKTRLAVQAAAELVDAFADGVFFVDLAPIRDPELVAPAIAGVLGLREAPGQPLLATLAEFLRGKALLLVLDNCEQVLAAAPLVADLLRAAPPLAVLAASRAPLRVSGEREVAVPPLALPDRDRVPPVAELARSEAVRLFVERARAVKADFALTEENAAAVAAVCRRVDGLPLAIELAAVRVKLLPPEALLRRLEQRLKVLTGGARDAPPRQQTLREAIAWSHDLLTPAEQALFRRLSVFVGGGTLEAAEAVCHAPGDLDQDVLDGLASLADKSLVRPHEQGGDEPRFGMLETIREYGLEQLAAKGEETAVRDAHAAHFLALAERAEPALYGWDQLVWLARLEAEHDNLRAALGWAIAERDETAARLAAALGAFWEIRGYGSEGRQWLERALAIGGEPAARAKLLNGAGYRAGEQGDYATATAWHEEALALHRGLGNERGVADALFGLGLVAMGQGDLDRAVSLLEEAASLFRAIGDERRTADALFDLGIAAQQRGEQQRAAALYEEVLAVYRAIGDQQGIAYALMGLSTVAREQGDRRRATALVAEALALCRTIGDRGGIASALDHLAIIAAADGQPKRAARLHGAADALRVALGAAPGHRERTYDAAFATAWAAGRVLTPEEAVAEALALADELAGAAPGPAATQAAERV